MKLGSNDSQMTSMFLVLKLQIVKFIKGFTFENIIYLAAKFGL